MSSIKKNTTGNIQPGSQQWVTVQDCIYLFQLKF
jgi:hypothetical protein